MPAWITSLFRELVPVPIMSALSSTITSRPAIASRRATASPTTPAPITTQATRSVILPRLFLHGGHSCAAGREGSSRRAAAARNAGAPVQIEAVGGAPVPSAFRRVTGCSSEQGLNDAAHARHSTAIDRKSQREGQG